MFSRSSSRSMTKPTPKLALVLFQVDMLTTILNTKDIVRVTDETLCENLEVQATWGENTLTAKVIALNDDVTVLNQIDRDLVCAEYVSNHPWQSELKTTSNCVLTKTKKPGKEEKPHALIRFCVDRKTAIVSSSTLQGELREGLDVVALWRKKTYLAEILALGKVTELKEKQTTLNVPGATSISRTDVLDDEASSFSELSLSEQTLQPLRDIFEDNSPRKVLQAEDLSFNLDIPEDRFQVLETAIEDMGQSLNERMDNLEQVMDKHHQRLDQRLDQMSDLMTRICEILKLRKAAAHPPTKQPVRTSSTQLQRGTEEATLPAPLPTVTAPLTLPVLATTVTTTQPRSVSLSPRQLDTTEQYGASGVLEESNRENVLINTCPYTDVGNLGHDPILIPTRRYELAKAKESPVLFLKKLMDEVFSPREMALGNEKGEGCIVLKDGRTIKPTPLDPRKLLAIKRAVQLEFPVNIINMTSLIAEKIRKVRYQYKKDHVL